MAFARTPSSPGPWTTLAISARPYPGAIATNARGLCCRQAIGLHPARYLEQLRIHVRAGEVPACGNVQNLEHRFANKRPRWREKHAYRDVANTAPGRYAIRNDVQSSGRLGRRLQCRTVISAGHAARIRPCNDSSWQTLRWIHLEGLQRLGHPRRADGVHAYATRRF